jgi:predicted RNase H-like HicB family nuclease
MPGERWVDISPPRPTCAGGGNQGFPRDRVVEARSAARAVTRLRKSLVLGRSSAYSSGVRLTAVITHESPWYVAWCLEVEVASQGESVEEALANLQEALELYFEDEPVPEGVEPPIIASVEVAA